jgi:hypothetical protein
LAKQHASYTLNDSQLPPDFRCTIQVLEEEQLGLKIPKDTIISVQEIDKPTPSSGDRDAAAKQKRGYSMLTTQTSNK